ncbi:L-type lectin-like domain-containing protein [Caenorhabditis elegans]|uniref:ERGIC-53-like protein n=1 Tax=Caenorhabditis elegans TaxID=6239 RepID=G5EDE8_CAEEL|nr:L-type lectin-like domain-containing protein [Caenorhabditis elegans]ABD34785.1 ERGIC-53-like protein [Caenorhabditis elegans]CAB03169.1 L-type lectin-like domain-containing protein [Caenorhabditis elegans]|eukprot:NP_492548.1 Intracellular LEctin [Caenorhabditis elegans]
MTSSRVLLVLLAVIVTIQAQNTPVFKKFEYKHSFRAPNLAQRDGSIPFWIVSGDAIASGEQLRLAPSMRSRKGIAWNKRAFLESENFQVDIALKIGGQGRVGADGLGIWYTSQLGALGPVFGGNDFWTGMGLFLDSFDNDGQKNNPQVSLMLNDGTRSYDHHTDGSQQILSSCQRDFRNKPYPVRIRIEYLKNVLTVHIDDGMQPTPRYELCMRAENIFLPRNGYFGVSAATGGLADDHDVLDFSVFSLFNEQQKPVPVAEQIPQQEKQKYDEEFERQMKEYEQERAKFKEQHPDKVKEDDEYDPNKYYEDATARELRLIYESQNAIHQVMQNMDQRLAQIQQAQTSGVAAAVPHSGGAAPAPVAAGGSFQQHEKNEVITSLRDLTQTIRDMKQYVNEIFTKTYNIDQKIAQGGAGAGGVDSSMHQKVDSLLNELRTVRATQIQTSGPGAAANCPNISCVSSTIFMLIIFIQSAIIVAVVFVRSKQDKAKFY